MKLFGLPPQRCEPHATDRRGVTAFAVWSPMVTPRRSVVENEHGFAMVSALMLVLLSLTLGSATLLYTLLDVKSTQHYKTGNQAFAAGEAGVLDVINTIDTRGVVNFQNDVVNSGIISTALTTLSGFPTVTYQVTSLVSGANPATDGTLTVTGKAPLSAERVIKVGLRRGRFNGGPGALHLSNDTASGTFSGNSMTIDGNNWNVTDITTNPPVATLDPSVAAVPAISTRNDTVSTQVITAIAGQGTITGLGSPSVMTTVAASTADLQKFVTDILAGNGAPNGCNSASNKQEYWLPGPCNSNPPVGPECGVHCIRKTNGNAQNPSADKWGSLLFPNVTYVVDTTAKIASGSFGAGILIFSGDTAFGGSFTFCGWVVFQNPSANGISITGNPTVFGEVLTPLADFKGGGTIAIKYSQNCLGQADGAGIKGDGNLPHPLQVTSWAD